MRVLWSSQHILCSDCGERSLIFPKLTRFMENKRNLPEWLIRRTGNRPRRPLHS